MGYKIGVKCNRITLFIKVYPETHHIYAYLHNKEVQMVSFITAVEINVHHFHHSTFNAQTYKQHTNKQIQWHTHTPIHNPADTFKGIG